MERTGDVSGAESQLSGFTTHEDASPTVAVDPDGGFLVTWWDMDGNGPLMARRFSSDGTALGSEIDVIPEAQEKVPRDVAFGSDGSFVVVWERSLTSDIHGRLFSSDGTPQGVAFQVNSYTTGFVARPRVASDAMGHFVVTWASNQSPGTDQYGQSVQARRFWSDGTPSGDQFQVNTDTVLDQKKPEIAMSPTGETAVIWRSFSSNFYQKVAFQSYQADGTPVGGEEQISSSNDLASSDNSYSAAITSGGEAVVIWDNFWIRGVYARRIDSSGNLFDEDAVQIHDGGDPLDIELDPALDLSDIEGFLVFWASPTSFGTDQDRYSIQGRLFDAANQPPIFADDFESGNCFAWSLCIGD